MDRRFPEWKEKETNKKLIIIISQAILAGMVLGMMQSIIIKAIPNDIELIWQIIASIVVGLAGAWVVILLISKCFKSRISRAIRPLIWDLRILHDRNIRQERVIELLKNADDDKFEYVGELKEEKHEETLSEITGENEQETKDEV